MRWRGSLLANDLRSQAAFPGAPRPLADRLAKAGVTANGVTLAALGLSLAHGTWLALMPSSRWPFLLLPVTLFLRMGLNAIDGMMAREHGMKSPEGAVLNELGDVVSDLALYLPFALVAGVNASLVVLVVISVIIGEMAGALGLCLVGMRRYNGPLGKSDRPLPSDCLAFSSALASTPGMWTTVTWPPCSHLARWPVNRGRGIVAEARSP